MGPAQKGGGLRAQTSRLERLGGGQSAVIAPSLSSAGSGGIRGAASRVGLMSQISLLARAAASCGQGGRGPIALGSRTSSGRENRQPNRRGQAFIGRSSIASMCGHAARGRSDGCEARALV